MNATTVTRPMKKMHHLPDDKILLKTAVEDLVRYIEEVNITSVNKIDLHIHQGVFIAGYTIGAGLLLPFIKKACNNYAYINKYRAIEVYLNAPKSLLYVIVKAAVEDFPVNDNDNQATFAITHKLITTVS